MRDDLIQAKVEADEGLDGIDATICNDLFQQGWRNDYTGLDGFGMSICRYWRGEDSVNFLFGLSMNEFGDQWNLCRD